MRLSGGEMDGAFEIKRYDPNAPYALDGLGDLTLLCEFGDEDEDANNIIAFEVAGVDTGDPNTDPNAADFCTANFVLDELILGRDANDVGPNACNITFTLVDEVNNGNRDANEVEALYVNKESRRNNITETQRGATV